MLERCIQTGKIVFATRAKAEARVKAIARDKHSRDSLGNYGSGKLCAYRCRFCGQFHTGHLQTKRKKPVKIRFEFIDE